MASLGIPPAMWILMLSPLLIANPWSQPLVSAIGLSGLIYVGINYMIPTASPALMKIGLVGRDRLKPNQMNPIPESLGSIVGVIYIFGVLLFTPFTLSLGSLAPYLSGILSIESMVMLGFADDLFDLRWRHKFFLPAIAAIPMLIVYYIEHGSTHIAVPPIINTFLSLSEPLPRSIDLGWVYYAYMAAVAIFATNCINIYAGVNGLEVGQTLVVAGAVLLNDIYYITAPALWSSSLPSETLKAHSLSVYFILPLFAGSAALLKWNWFPAKVFVGDSFCYFGGMVLAVAGILGHFSKTMLSFIFPQIVNFLYSMPQLLRIVPCPRHRMPSLDPGSQRLVPSRFSYKDLSPWKVTVLRVLAFFKLIKLWEETREASNMTLINLTLVHMGPITESQLSAALLTIQIISCSLALIGRHMLGRLLFGYDNLT